jgi:hypothetical protein
MSKLQFDTNVPLELCLRSIEGEPAPSQFGDDQIRFTTTDGDIFYVSGRVGEIIADTCRKLRIDNGEPVVICKAEVPDGRGRKAIRWQVRRVGEQADGTFAVPRVNGANGSNPPAPPQQAVGQTAAPQPNHTPNGTANGHANGHANGNGQSNGNGDSRTVRGAADIALSPNGHTNGAEPSLTVHAGWAQYLLQTTDALIDVYAAALRYAGEKHGNTVKPDDVRSLLLSAYINQSKVNGNGGRQ